MQNKRLLVVRLGLVLLGVWWGIIGIQWLWHLKGGLRAARAWFLHVAFLGVPGEQRSGWPQVVDHLIHAYETIILWLLITIVLMIIERYLTIVSLKQNMAEANIDKLK